jgi:hypothetical protein
MYSISLIKQIDGKKREKQSWTIHHLVINCLMFVYFPRICIHMRDAVSKGHSMCTRAKRNHHIIHPILVPISTRLFFSSFFLYLVLSHYRCRFSTKRMHFFLLYIYIYIHISVGSKQILWAEQKSFSFFSRTYTHWR